MTEPLIPGTTQLNLTAAQLKSFEAWERELEARTQRKIKREAAIRLVKSQAKLIGISCLSTFAVTSVGFLVLRPVDSPSANVKETPGKVSIYQIKGAKSTFSVNDFDLGKEVTAIRIDVKDKK